MLRAQRSSQLARLQLQQHLQVLSKGRRCKSRVWQTCVSVADVEVCEGCQLARLQLQQHAQVQSEGLQQKEGEGAPCLSESHRSAPAQVCPSSSMPQQQPTALSCKPSQRSHLHKVHSPQRQGAPKSQAAAKNQQLAPATACLSSSPQKISSPPVHSPQTRAQAP